MGTKKGSLPFMSLSEPGGTLSNAQRFQIVYNQREVLYGAAPCSMVLPINLASHPTSATCCDG